MPRSLFGAAPVHITASNRMRIRLLQLRDVLKDSFWFIPALMALTATVLALYLVSVDHVLGSDWVKNFGWIWSGGPDGARSVLATVAGSMMTVISIVFSLTITTLAQTSSHFGPRVLRNFTSHRGVQFTLGVFIATFVFCLLVLRTVRSVQESEFVPYLAVNVGVLLTLSSLAVLIYFIHHIAQSIQAERLIADVGRDIMAVLGAQFPNKKEETRHSAEPSPAMWEQARTLAHDDNGYVQHFDLQTLIVRAAQIDVIVRVHARPGDFVWGGAPLLDVLPPERVTAEVRDRLVRCFSLGRRRTPRQDAVYAVQQLVEIAAHALSPGINEPFTALACIDWLGAALALVTHGNFSSEQCFDEQGALRALVRPVTFDELAHTSFDQIRLYGANNTDVMLRLLGLVGALAGRTSRKEIRRVLSHHANLIATDSAHIVNAQDRQRVMEAHAATLNALAKGRSDVNSTELSNAL